jgi:tetratricopeptide (TPR) repeat protein
MAASRQALDLAVALGDRALQVEAAHRLGQTYSAIGDFGRAVELLRRNVEAADGPSGMSSINVRLISQAMLARTLGTLGTFAEGRRHGEEALRLATLEGRGATPIIVHAFLSQLYLAQGDLEHAIRMCDQGLALSRASGNRNMLPVIVAGLGYAYRPGTPGGRARAAGKVSEHQHGCASSCPLDVAQRGCRLGTRCRGSSTRARRPTWPGSRRTAAMRRSRCTSSRHAHAVP